jgi:60 kDa SS-A/Ro ribonucleoprotein
MAKNKKSIKVTYKLTNELHQELASVYEYLNAYEEIKKSLDEKSVLELSKKHGFQISQALKINKSSSVWEFYVQNDLVPLRNLLKMLPDLTKKEILTDALTQLICQKLEDEEIVKKIDLHPFNWYTIQKVYAKGGKNYAHRFKPNEKILKSIENAFNMSFKHLEINERKFAVCLNTWILSKQLLHKSTAVTPFQAGVIMLLCSLHSHPNSKLFLFKAKLEEIQIKKEEMSFSILVQKLFQNTIGSVNLADNISSFNENFDDIVIYSTTEPDLKNKPAKAIKAFREKFNNQNTKLVYISLSPSNNDVADPKDPNMLDIRGFAHDYPNILNNYLKGLF